MIDYGALIKIIPVFMLALISPGPDFMVVSSTSLSHGRTEGIRAAAGVASVIFIYTFVSLMGLSALFERYLWLMIVVKTCGGLYLIYLGLILFKSSFAKADTVAETPPQTLRKNAYIAGALVCLTNPKAIAFFASIFALALTPHTSLATNMVIGATIPLLTLIWFSLVATGLSAPPVRLRYERWRRVIDRATGFVMTVLGVKLLTSIDH